ncbi:MAG: RraA family protein [Methanobrevibacter sp.]|uniref:RraA family protein n=1 Tax=Methanobrevibacter sp. TaxID=66852 RepID=UPI0025FE3362|nr:RraA family protein [Methanobrevibacter sp.]MBR0271577.1 RraA family protein [Methanobrevibacter sp.]
MSIKPKDLLKNKKDLDKKIAFDEISLEDIAIDDLTYNGDNYKQFINLNSFLDNVSSCQISDAFNEIAHRSGVLYNLKSINNLKTWGRITTSRTDSDDWGTITLAIDEAKDGDVLLVEVSDMDAAIWGELASTCAKNNGVKSTLVYGCVRDLDALLTMNYPIFACGFRPNAGKALGLGEINIDLELESMKISPGDFLYGDETGVVIIPKEFFNDVMLKTYEIKIKEKNITEMLNSGKSLSQVVGLR